MTARDRGSASVVLLAVGLVMLAAGLAGAAVGAAHVARHQARTAADLGALAGAVRAGSGPVAACARAEQIVSVNGARMITCELDGLDLTVTVEVTPVAVAAGLSRPATATARAGPLRAADRPGGTRVGSGAARRP